MNTNKRLEKPSSIFLPAGLSLLAVLYLLLSAPLLFAEEKEFDVQVFLTKKQALEFAFPGVDKVDRKKKWLTDGHREKIGKLSKQEVEDRRITFYVGRKGSKATGYMVIGNVIGKAFPITFMVVLNVDGTIRNVEIMVYREPQGGEVKNKSFLQQFMGMKSGSDFRNINAITGATLSVNGIRRGVSKVVAAYKVLYLDENP